MVNPRSRVPSEKNFLPDSDGLSVDWNRFTTPSRSLVRQGLTYKTGTTDFKDPNNFFILELNVSEVKLVNENLTVMHTPVFNGNPAPIGNPNNQSHSSILGYTEFDEEIRVKLRDIARKVIDLDYDQIMFDVNGLRQPE